MKGKDVRCPRCGEGFRDIAPDYDFNDLSLLPMTAAQTYGKCVNGHGIMVETTWPDGEAKYLVVPAERSTLK